MAGIVLLALAGVGALTLTFVAYTIFNFATFHLTTPSLPLNAYKRAGPDPTYALVTGASAGIGYGIARALVTRGFGVIILGHLKEELEESAAKLRKLNPSLPPTAVRTIVMNAQTATTDELEAAVRSIADLQVTILVNNVGSNPISQETGPIFRTHANYTFYDVDAVIDMNNRFMARLTALMLPLLSRRAAPEQRSLILSVSSAGAAGVPWLVLYGATKGFVNSFSFGLARELEAVPETAHVDCLAIQPGEVRTQGNSVGVWEGEPDAEKFGRLVVERADGAVKRKMRALRPYWVHDLQVILLGFIPESVATDEVTKRLAHKRDMFNGRWEMERKGK